MTYLKFRIVLLILLVLAASGCGAIRNVSTTTAKTAVAVGDKWFAQPGVREADRRQDLANGAQTQPSLPTLATHASLVSDHRAALVGQSVTVLVLERASSTTSADTRTRSALDANTRLDATFRFDEGGVDVDGTSIGAGSINREGELIASVSAVVAEILPSGELMIFGEQTIEVNDETQYIRVAGRIRPEDISGDNTVLSTRMADAHIMYKGYGILGETQKPGVLTRLFNWVF